MWNVNGQTIRMAEGDWGIKLPVTLNGMTLTASDEVRFVIKTAVNGNVIVSKTFTNIAENTVDLELTEAESELLPVGSYVYLLDWYQDGAFMCNIITSADFKVVDKA